MTGPGWYLNQVFLTIRTRGRPGKVPVGEINRSQTVCRVMVIEQSLGSWSHLWSLSNVSGCGSTSLLFGSCAGTHQIRDQSRALEDRNDSNNSLEVYTPNSFIHLFYNSPYMDIVDMHSILITPSDSVLWEKTMEASYLVGSFPCQFNFISVFDIPGWDEVWEQATSRHFCPFPIGCSQHISTVPTARIGGNPGIKDSSNSPLSVTADRCEK